MRKKLSFVLIILIIASLMGGCFGKIEEGPGDKNSQTGPDEGIGSQGDSSIDLEIDHIKEKIKKMTLEEKIGQIFIMGLDGYEADNDIKEMIEEDYIGGIILFSRNVKKPEQLLELTNSLKNINSANHIPLFISVDQEGGRVNRMPRELKNTPSNRIIGQKNDRQFAYEIGAILGQEVKSFGFNMNFAPVLDIDSNPNNPVIGDRSFASNEKLVADLGLASLEGLRSQGVIPVVKHFPGHGDTLVDSHIGLPRIDKELSDLHKFELIPFKKAIENNIDAIMVAHILFDKIDPQNPASLSKPITIDLLRDQLKFNGVVITDDMTMGAILENYDIGHAAVMAVDAGCDLVLVSHGHDNKLKALQALKEAVQDQEISMDRIDESLYRILQLKEKYELNNSKIESVDINKINSDIIDLLGK